MKVLLFKQSSLINLFEWLIGNAYCLHGNIPVSCCFTGKGLQKYEILPWFEQYKCYCKLRYLSQSLMTSVQKEINRSRCCFQCRNREPCFLSRDIMLIIIICCQRCLFLLTKGRLESQTFRIKISAVGVGVAMAIVL